MTVQELIEQLMRYDLDSEVVIAASCTFVTAGPRPTTSITGASKGTDWDRGKIFIGTAAHLVQLNSYQYTKFTEVLREHDWIRDDIWKGRKPRGVIPPMFNPYPPEEKTDE